MEEIAISSRLTTQEKLLVAQAVHKLGAVNWEKISELLENHPVIEGRPKEWFDATTVEAYYVGLMTEIGINVPAQDAAKPRAKVHLRLAQTFYLARLQELKSSIAEYEQTFSKLMSEVTAIKSGSMDKVLKDEVRAVLARKFGKKLLDSWVPDEEAMKEAVEAGPPSEEELKEVEEGKEAVGVVEGVSAEADTTVAPADEAKDQRDGPTPVDSTKEDDAVAKEIPAEEKEPEVPQGDIGMEEAQATPQVEETASSPAAEADKEDPAMSPASDLSSAPDDKPSTPVKSTRNTGKAGKRKASTQPKGVPQSKRSTRRRTTATPGVVPAEDEVAVVGTADADTAKEVEEEEEPIVVEDETPVKPEAEPQPELEPDSAVEPATPAPIEDEAPKRGRRPNKRESTVRRQSTRKATSPEASTRHSSPLNSKRAPSASSARSGTPATEERRSRRAPRGRGMRDEVVSKSVRGQSTAGESVREDDEAEETPKASEAEVEAKAEEEAEDEAVVSEAERPPTRQSRRAKGNAGPSTPKEKPETPQESEAEDAEEEETERPPTRSSRRAKDTATPVPERMKEVATERKSTRRSSARGAMTIEDDDKPEVKEEPKDRRTIKRPRESSPKEIKATQKMLTGLLDQIQDQKSGSLFMNPVKAGDAPGYADVIKRPMALKTIRAKIKNQQITTVDEFERDIMLIFANAIMYNKRGTQVHDAALEMIKEAERHIAHFKSVQLHINGQVGGG